MKTDVLVELKTLRLHGMAGAWADLIEQGDNAGIESSRWLIEHLLQAEGTDRAIRSVNCQRRLNSDPRWLKFESAPTTWITPAARPPSQLLRP